MCTCRASKMTRAVRRLPLILSLYPTGLTEQKERTKSCKLSPDLHTCRQNVLTCTQTHAHT